VKGWNPFGKIDLEKNDFLKSSPFNKIYYPENHSEEKAEIDMDNRTDVSIQ